MCGHVSHGMASLCDIFDPLWKFTIILTGMSEKAFDFIHYHLSLIKSTMGQVWSVCFVFFPILTWGGTFVHVQVDKHGI